MPDLLVFTSCEEMASAVGDVCNAAGWSLRAGESDPSHWNLAETHSADAALFDLENPLGEVEAITDRMSHSAPFLPLVFVSRTGRPLEEFGGGLRYHLDPGHVDDLEHILISLTLGFHLGDALPTAPSHDRHVPRVLIVDDNIQLAMLMERALRATERLDVRVAFCGFEAASIVPSFNPDVAIVDLVLGDTDGRDVCALIRGDERLKETKIIGMSGYVPKDRSEEGRVHFDAFMEKPFRVRRLVDTVMQFLNK